MTSGTDDRDSNGCDEKEEVLLREMGFLVLAPSLEPLCVNPRAVMLLSDLAGMPPETLNPTGHIAMLPPNTGQPRR
jgi:hypothetical protein